MMVAESCHNQVFLISPEAWTAVWTMALTFVTAALVAVGFVQLRALREDAILGRTLEQCNQYQLDPVLDSSLRNLSIAWRTQHIRTHSEQYRSDVVTVLNYLDSLAFGCISGIYLENFVKTHMNAIFSFHYEQYLGTNRLPIAELDLDDYVHIRQCTERWSQPPLWHRRV